MSTSYLHLLEKTNGRVSKKLANNTYVELRLLSNGVARPALSVQDWQEYPETHRAVAVRLHQTDVVTFTGDGYLILDTGGWKTVTTKDRINTFTPYDVNVWSDKGEWRLHYSGGSVPFADGVTLENFSLAGIGFLPVEGTYPNESQERLAKEAKARLKKDVEDFLKKADRSLEAWAVTVRETGSLNTSGDCFYCRGLVSDTEGEVATGTDHLWSHLREGYVFPSLFLSAYASKGYRVPGAVFGNSLLYRHDDAKKVLKQYLLKTLGNSSEPTSDIVLNARYLEQAREVLERPGDFGYFGGDENLWVASAPTWTKHRDSENLEIANFEIVWEGLKAEFPDLFHDDLDDEGYPSRDFNEWPAIYVFGASHWAVGHIDQIVVPVLKDKDQPLSASNLHPAFIKVCEYNTAVRSYPALDGAEERADQLTSEQITKSVHELVAYLDDDRVTPYADQIAAWWVETEGDGEEQYGYWTDDILKAHADLVLQEAYVEAEGQQSLV